MSGDERGPTWWLLASAGLLVLAFGLRGLVAALDPPALLRWALWAAGALLVHDLVLAPAVRVLGHLVDRAVPPPARLPVQVGLVLSGVVGLVALPVVTGFGRAAQPGNASVLPLDYPANLAGVLAVVWALTAVIAAWRHRAAGRSGTRRRPRPGPGG